MHIQCWINTELMMYGMHLPITAQTKKYTDR